MVWVTPPPVAVTVMKLVPVWVRLLALTVKVVVPVPGAAMLLGLKETDSFFASPEAEKPMDELKETLAVVVMEVEMEDPWVTISAVLAAERLKSAGVEDVTVSDTVVVCVTPPPVPVMVMG